MKLPGLGESSGPDEERAAPLSFMEKVRRARALLEQEGRVSLRALRRELELDDDELDELADELVEIQQVARVEGRALRMMCEALEAVEAGHIKKLLVNVPPGFMKSMLLDVMFPTWVWGPRNRPDRRFCSWSYSDEITIRDNVKKRDIVRSELYQSLWGDRFKLSGDQNEKKYIKNDKTGFWFAAGIHGGGTGHRGDFAFIDDPHKVKEAESEPKRLDANLFVAETWPSRKNDDSCAFVCIMQRVHEADVS